MTAAALGIPDFDDEPTKTVGLPHPHEAWSTVIPRLARASTPGSLQVFTGPCVSQGFDR
jgi:hypothetical protein